jgi:hypothetical protein
VKLRSEVVRIPRFVEVAGTPLEIDAYWNALSGWASTDWARDQDAEENHSGKSLIFRYQGGQWPEARAYVAPLGTEIRLAQLLAVESELQLTPDEIDALSLHLVEDVLRPVNDSLPMELVLEIGPSEEHLIELAGLSYLDFEGGRRHLKHDYYSAYDFVQEAKSYWIEPFKCKECGKRSTCVFPQRHPNMLHSEQLCEVVQQALTTTAEHVWPALATTDSQHAQDTLDALFRATRFADEGERSIGRLCSRSFQDWLSSIAPIVLSDPIYLRSGLDALAGLLNGLPFGQQNRVVLVEGESEAAFLVELTSAGRLTGTSASPYAGAGNVKQLLQLVKHLKGRGMRVFVQGDLDGKEPENRRTWREKLEAQGAQVFLFRQDFETAFTAQQRVLALSSSAEISVEEARNVLDNASSLTGALDRFTIPKTAYARALARVWAHPSEWDAECEITDWIRQLENRPKTPE